MDRHVIPCHLVDTKGQRVASFAHQCRGPGATTADIVDAGRECLIKARELGRRATASWGFANGEYRLWVAA